MLKCHVLVFILIAKNSNDRLLVLIDRLLFLIQSLCFLLIIERKVFDPIFCCDLFFRLRLRLGLWISIS